MGVDARTCWYALQNQPTRFCGKPTAKRRGLGNAWNETGGCGLTLPTCFPPPPLSLELVARQPQGLDLLAKSFVQTSPPFYSFIH